MASTADARESIRLAEARARVLAVARPLPTERVPLAEARGRALSREVVATHDLPPFRNASMDGIAVRSADLVRATVPTPALLHVIESIPAGRVPSRPLGEGEAMRIMTGAMMPEGSDAVVPVEGLAFETDAGREMVRLAAPSAASEHVRGAGEDLHRGEVAVPAGRELSPHDLALLAALGQAEVEVGGRPRVAVISTGDELLAVDAPLRPGAIRDSNLPMMVSLLDACGARVVMASRCPDDPAELVAHVRQALGIADVVITLGGVSAGEFDPVKRGLKTIGGIALWRVAMKPGQPQAFGAPEGRLFFGVPGNPASVACVFEALVRPALRRLQGFSELDRPRVPVRAMVSIASREGRTDFVRVTLGWRDGAWWATPAGAQVSGHLAPQSRADALLVVPESDAALSAGEPAEALLLRWPGTTTA